MDDPSHAPASPKSPFLDYMAAASPTYFNSKHIEDKLAKSNSKLQMILSVTKNWEQQKESNLWRGVASQGE